MRTKFVMNAMVCTNAANLMYTRELGGRREGKKKKELRSLRGNRCLVQSAGERERLHALGGAGARPIFKGAAELIRSDPEGFHHALTLDGDLSS